jgi:hypothetical protein
MVTATAGSADDGVFRIAQEGLNRRYDDYVDR